MNNKKEAEKIKRIKEKALSEARNVAPQYCEKCGTKYNDDSFNLVQKNQGQTVFHLKCPKCNNTYILNVVSPGPNILASQRSMLNIDLNDPHEMTKFAGRKKVSMDEALDVKSILKDNSIESLLR